MWLIEWSGWHLVADVSVIPATGVSVAETSLVASQCVADARG